MKSQLSYACEQMPVIGKMKVSVQYGEVNKAHYRVVNERLALYTGEKLAGATTLKFLTEEKSRVTPRQIFSHV